MLEPYKQMLQQHEVHAQYSSLCEPFDRAVFLSLPQSTTHSLPQTPGQPSFTSGDHHHPTIDDLRRPPPTSSLNSRTPYHLPTILLLLRRAEKSKPSRKSPKSGSKTTGSVLLPPVSFKEPVSEFGFSRYAVRANGEDQRWP
ncbi:hypothetical protein Droror1_Dr00024223 [Drosera rotundifolia]